MLINDLKACKRQLVQELERIRVKIVAKKAMIVKYPAIAMGYVGGLVETANQTESAGAAIQELDMVITWLKGNIAEAWQQNILSGAAAGYSGSIKNPPMWGSSSASSTAMEEDNATKTMGSKAPPENSEKSE